MSMQGPGGEQEPQRPGEDMPDPFSMTQLASGACRSALRAGFRGWRAW
jgi:hypothetical protein